MEKEMKEFGFLELVILLTILAFIVVETDMFDTKEPLPAVELKQLYLIDGEYYKPVEVLNCMTLQTYRKSIHAWDLCRNPIHFNR